MSSEIALEKSAGRPALWFWAAAGLGLAWNLFGAVQFIGSLSATPESLQAQGLTADQAAVMLGYPAWMTVVFAIGVFGGALGCGLLLVRKASAVPVFAASLAGYIALYLGDIVHGVFAALGTPQVVVLSIVVLIAAALLWLARHARGQGILT
ncbi:hypothetical protein [Tabrizicola sp.]|uniref:hypothetical protein n=1 Tax=Tabrizicola sp. TaxID=2005166 RepID=UPI0027363EF8|nr:hypothetical protein [Tabrizicola sp.]MDP3196786.1 hypothetical protein [Tabrizicola sp.]